MDWLHPIFEGLGGQYMDGIIFGIKQYARFCSLMTTLERNLEACLWTFDPFDFVGELRVMQQQCSSPMYIALGASHFFVSVVVPRKKKQHLEFWLQMFAAISASCVRTTSICLSGAKSIALLRFESTALLSTSVFTSVGASCNHTSLTTSKPPNLIAQWRVRNSPSRSTRTPWFSGVPPCDPYPNLQ